MESNREVLRMSEEYYMIIPDEVREAYLRDTE
jgi:bifunctional DNA-binding transcriptional regulator/antitoxin component of YhaV-PrlF toxin-antitoxin module